VNVAFLVGGMALLAGGGQALIRGALDVARRLNVSPLLAGLVIVGFGTSMPELAVSVNAAAAGNAEIAIGNVVGSNIGNVLLILGLCAVISPLTVSPAALRRDGLIVLASSVLFVALAFGGKLTRIEGGLLLVSLAVYVFWTYRSDRKQQTAVSVMHREESTEVQKLPPSKAITALLILVGLAALIGGAQALVHGAVGLARSIGLSEATIGLTVVAVGTSLPEMMVSVVAAVRRHGDVAIGNILGSNIFNMFGILGVSILVTPMEVVGRVAIYDQWVLLGTAVALIVFLATQRRLTRGEGVLLLSSYGAYVVAGLIWF
jgi:cation:H+ antiporter